MCLIICSENGVVPTKEILDQGRRSNSDGIGLAWKFGGSVYFRKGISFDELVGRVESIGRNKNPYIVHFRIATSGARVPELCHPFPIVSKTNQLFRLRGQAQSVMAHNGTWYGWKQAIDNPKLVEAIESNHWSDSAVMAWLFSQKKTIKLSQTGYGHRVAILSTKRGLDLFGHFSTDPETGIHYSNRSWAWQRTVSSKTNNFSFFPYSEEIDLEDEDPCAIPLKEDNPKPVDGVIIDRASPSGLLTYQGNRGSEDSFIARSTTPASGTIITRDGKRMQFFNDGGWRPVG